MGTFTLTQVHLLGKNGTFTSLLWAMLLSLLYLNAIQVKSASIYSKHAVYFSLCDVHLQMIHSFELILFIGLVKAVDNPVNWFANQFEWFVQFPDARAESSEADQDVRVLSLRSSVIHGFCDRALTLPSCPDFMWVRGFECARAVRSLAWMPCLMLERGVQIRVGVWTLALRVLSRCVSVRSRVRSAARSPVHVCFVVLRAVCAFIGCVHSCYVLCCVYGDVMLPST